jgi:uncharacterized membrane protein HdeD (DUF308 family)
LAPDTALATDITDLVPTPPESSRLARDSDALRTFTLAEGVVMLILGSLALIFPVLASGPPV